MNKKDILGPLLISIGLSFIFGVAAHAWYRGLIVGIVFFVGSMFIIKAKNKNDKNEK